MYKQANFLSLFGQEELNRVLARQRGGKAGQKGTRFEDYFAVYQLTQQLSKCYSTEEARFKDETAAVVLSQVLSFVDDVVVNLLRVKEVEHYQCKNKKSVSWGSGNQSMKQDFQSQGELSKSAGLSAKMFLVVPTNALQTKLKRTKNKHCSEVIVFPPIGFDRLVQEYEPFRKALTTVSACRESQVETSTLLALARRILSAWIAAPNKLSIKSLAADLEKQGGPFARAKGGGIKSLAGDVEAILSRVPGFQYQMCKGFLYWQCGPTNSGVFPHHSRTVEFSNLMSRMRKSKPKTFNEIEEQLV